MATIRGRSPKLQGVKQHVSVNGGAILREVDVEKKKFHDAENATLGWNKEQ